VKFVKYILFSGCILLGILQVKGIYGKGLQVSPSSYTWHNVVLGIEVKCPVNVLIKNESEYSKSYTLRVVNPSEINVDIPNGSKELPSKKWISFNTKRIAIGPGESKQVAMLINIPDEKKYLNETWCFFIEVKEYTSAGTVFALACYPKFIVVTKNLLLKK